MEDSPNAKSPDTETPPQPKPTANGAFKRRHRLQPPAVVFYRECMKNHAAGIGGLAVDGCGEFMASPAATNSDPSSLKCAACGCHRNFHRREAEDPSAAHFISFRLPPPLHRSSTPSPSASRSPSPPLPGGDAPHMLLALSSGDSGRRKTLNPRKNENPSGGKRFRTKFSHTQKMKMQGFAEKLGWKMSKSDETAVDEFCDEVGVTRSVLKVWIHNNKQGTRKRDHHQMNNNITENGNGISFETEDCNNTDHENHQNECNIFAHLRVSTNGSSSSS